MSPEPSDYREKLKRGIEYEYSVRTYYNAPEQALENHLNQFGEQGWELVSISKNGTGTTIYMKREK